MCAETSVMLRRGRIREALKFKTQQESDHDGPALAGGEETTWVESSENIAVPLETILRCVGCCGRG